MANRIKGITVEIGGDTTGLSDALKKVNGQISSTQSQLNDVNKLLKLDPSNTELLAQKQRLLEEAVKGTSEKLETLKQASEQAKDAMEKGTLEKDKYEALQREIIATEQQTKKFTEQLKKEDDTFDQNTAEILAATKQSDKYSDELNDIDNKSKKASESTKDLDNSVSGLGGNLSTAAVAVGTFMGNLAVDAIESAGSAVKQFASDSIQTGMDFDSAMAQVAATSGKTVDEITDLRDFAQEMGSTTAFSATEAADGLNYMALAGYDAETSMAMLPTVLNLASAGGMELADASDMVTDAQTALGLSVEETSTMVDMMAKASSNSNTSVSQLGEAILTIGGTAKGLSGGTQELSTMLGVLADNGIKGAEAGTHLRNIMLAMNPTTDKAKEAWEELGVSAYDADGNLRPLNETFADINEAMEGYTDEAKTETLTAMFNKTDLSSINAMLDTSADRYEQLGEAIGDCSGAAQDMANTQLDNLSGDITLFQSALEGAQIALSDKMTPALRGVVSAGSDVMTALTDGFADGDFSGVSDAMSEVMDAVSDTLDNMLPEIMDIISEIISAIGNALISAFPQIVNIGTQLLLKLVAGIVRALPQLVTAAMQGITTLINGINQALPQLLAMLPTIITSVLNNIIANLPMLLTASLQLILTLVQGLADALPVLIDYVPTLVTTITQFILENLPLIIDTATQIIVAIIEGLTQALPQLIGYVPTIILNIIAIIIAMLPQILESGAKLIKALIDGIGSLNDALKTAVNNIIKKIVNAFMDTVDTVLAVGKSIIAGLISGIAQKASDVKDKVGEVVTAIKTKFLDFVDDVKDIGKNIVEGLWNGISDKVDWLCTKIKGFSSTVTDELKDFFGIHSPSRLMRDEVGNYLAEGIGVGFMDGLGGVISDVKRASAQMTNSIQGAIGGNYSATLSNGGAISGASAGTTIINNDYSKTVNQTNNSPASLSRLEIYRQTTNALKI